MSAILNQVRQGFYMDSVALMRLSRTIAGLPGVQEAALMMATPANLEIMDDAGLLDGSAPDTASAAGGDLLIAVRADNADAAQAAMTAATDELDCPNTLPGEGTAWKPRTLRAARKSMPDANLALISVPGVFAAAEARKAIRRGMHAMIFSDNVALEEEAELKREARDLGRLVMGPDCGTAIIGGVPLAFANVVPSGSIGIVGASGTGTQEVSCLVAQLGHGISHAIGVGGRDLKSEVGGISTLMAIDALDADPGTEQIVLISKPPPDDVAALVLDRLGQSSKPATVCFLGADALSMPANATQVFTLKDAAHVATGEAPATPAAPDFPAPSGTQVAGFFAGGTLCAEAQVIMRRAGEAVASNAPIPGVPDVDGANQGHRLLDLGDDEFTQGRPHPMIDPGVRDAALIEALGDPDVAVVLIDNVIGYGAHADPAGHLAGVLAAHGGGKAPLVIASVTGTEADPQGRTRQVATLEAAGIAVAPSNADAVEWALRALGRAS